MSVQEFLNSISNPRTRKGYRFGLNKFVEWFGKSAEEILAIRQEDLTQTPGENLVEYKNRAARFEKEEKKGGFEGLERREYSDEDKPRQRCFSCET